MNHVNLISGILVAVVGGLGWKFIVIFHGLIGNLILVCVLGRVLMGSSMGSFISFFMWVGFIGFVVISMDRMF